MYEYIFSSVVEANVGPTEHKEELQKSFVGGSQIRDHLHQVIIFIQVE